jgi:hypothetical protein
MKIFLAAAAAVLFTFSASAQLFNFTTLAGSVGPGSQNGPETNSQFFNPGGLVVDASGNIFIADTGNNTIREITAAGTVSTFAGYPGIVGSADGVGTNALFNAPLAVALDGAGNLFVSDTGNNTIREITPAGTVTTFAGSPGFSGSADGTNSGAQFFQPAGITVDAANNIFVADSANNTIRKITPAGVVTTFAGCAAASGNADGAGDAARFNHPFGVARDTAGNLFVTDLFNHTIREITSGGITGTPAGLPGLFGSADGTNSNVRFFEPEGIAVDGAENIYVADAGNHAIRQLTPAGTNWIVTTLAGWPGNSGNADGSGIAARFCYPDGLALTPAGTLLVIDSGNNSLRAGTLITNNPPAILSSPQAQSVNAGDSATFSVSVADPSALYYQWQFNGVNIPGAIENSFTVSDAQLADAGNYSVIVSSPTGSVLSSNAVLTVYAPPAITNQPANQVCLQGATVTFSVIAGPPPLTYQWQKNGIILANAGNVSGATAATLTLSNVTTADSANYSALINNGYGFITSSNAVLTVFAVPPADSVQPYAWWQLNEGTGTTAFDYSGNGHNGTLNSGATWTNVGHAGNGVYFDGTNAADIAINSSFTLTGNWTAAMWVNRWGTKASSVLIGGSAEALKLEQQGQTNHVGYTHYGAADYPLNYLTPLNTWTHLVFVKTTAGVSLYANGVFVASDSAAISLSATALGLGYPTVTTDFLDATLNDVRLYTSALTASQITNLFAYGRISPLPAITLTAPANGQSFIVATNIALAANVVSNGQSLVIVKFYAGTNLLGQAAVAPYTWTWTNVLAGNYLLTASAVFNGTSTVTSSPVGIYVAPATNRIALTFAMLNGALALAWPPDHTGWRLQAQTNPPDIGLTTNWVEVAGATMTNQMIIPVTPANGSVFYRLIYP